MLLYFQHNEQDICVIYSELESLEFSNIYSAQIDMLYCVRVNMFVGDR